MCLAPLYNAKGTSGAAMCNIVPAYIVQVFDEKGCLTADFADCLPDRQTNMLQPRPRPVLQSPEWTACVMATTSRPHAANSISSSSFSPPLL